MLANAAELDLGQPDGVAVGDIEWSRTNSITDLGGTATFQSTPYVYDSYDLQPTWDQATGGISENTAAGVCPPNWRLPTRLEAIDLLSPSISTSVWVNDAGPGGNIAGRQVTISADGQTLFFSASGYSSNYQGNGAEFWTSTMRNVSNAFSLDFAEAPNIASVNNNSKGYHFSIRCVRPAGGTRSLTRAGVGDVAVGQTYDQVREAMVGALAGKPYPAPTDAANDYSIPMWGEDEYEGETTTVIDIALRRSLARVDVGVGAWDDDDNNWAGLPSVFEMTDVVVVHPNDKYSLIPDPASLSVDNPATADTDESGAPSSPSVPTGTAQFSPEDSFAYSGAVMANEIYLPEAVLAGVADTDRMALIIGGHYRGSADVTWYRVDFRLADGSLTDVVRNHLYRFSITSVSSPGLPDIEQAYNSVRSSMSVSVVDWNEVVFAPGL